MAQIIPIRFQEAFNLSTLGLQPASFSIINCTMQSEKFVCIRDVSKEPAQLVVFNVEDKTSSQFPLGGDSSIMHPSAPIIAVKAAQVLQVYNIAEKAKLKTHTMDQPVTFWKWISDNTMVLVTEAAVFHWTLEGNLPPTKMFDRVANLAGHQIINYVTDSSQKWLALVGITQKDGRVAGTIQLHSTERNQTQTIEGHAASFVQFTPKNAPKPITLFVFANKGAAASKVFALEVTVDTPSPLFEKVMVDYFVPREAVGDFPVALQTSKKYGVAYMITKLGYIYLFDVASGKTIFCNRISSTVVFTTVAEKATGGIIGINQNGQVLMVTIDESTLVPYIVNTLNDIPLAITFASRCNLPGAEELFVRQFNQLFQSGDFQSAARVAAEAPSGILRTPQTVQLFKASPGIPGQPSPILQYFSVLLETTVLNPVETLELARPLISQGRKEILERWLQQDKLGCSEELGDLVHQVDPTLALTIYFKAEAKHKVVACFAELGQFDKILPYSKKAGFSPDWNTLLQHILAVNPKGAAQLALMLLNDEAGPLVDINYVVELFLQRSLTQEATAILIEYLKPDRPEDAALQTRLFEISLLQNQTQLVEGILANDLFHHYDRPTVARFLEKAGMFQRALQHYSEISDVKRILVNAHLIAPNFLLAFLQNASNELALESLKELLRVSRQQNMDLIAMLAAQFSERLGHKTVIGLFESFQAFDGMFLYLSQIVNVVQDAEVHFKYIEAAVKTKKFEQVEKFVRDSKFYEPVRVKEFLKESKLQDQVPLIIVCDLYGFVEDLTKYLYDNGLTNYLNVYVCKVNPNQTPAVVGALLDVDCNEDYIRTLVKSVGKLAPTAELVSACEKRSRLKILLSWLEDRIQEGNTETATHNALAKILFDLNRDVEGFLVNNQYYDSRDVGKYYEKREPHLSFIAYKRGLCDAELIDLTNRNGMFRQQAKYLVGRQNEPLWLQVLVEENEHRRTLIDQVIQTALPESENPDEVSSTVKAFMSANLPNELIELLEKIVIDGKRFNDNRNLQNLLILTAIKANAPKTMEYIKQLDNYNAPDIANIAIGAKLYEHAFEILKKFKHNTQAIQVLIDHSGNLERASAFAEQLNEPEVFSKLGLALLNAGSVKEAIHSFVRSKDHQYYMEVITAAEQQQHYNELIGFLQMCRKVTRDPHVDTELIYCFAKIGSNREISEFISSPNYAQIQQVGDRCFAEGLYEAAKTLFNNISNFARLASTLVKLNDFSGGVEAARKANNLRTWKEVCAACVDAQQFRSAQVCGLYIIIHTEELDEIIHYYEERGYFEELIALIEAGLNMERAHIGMFTELAILYSKYKPEKLMEHIRLFHARMTISKIIRVCEKNHQWLELTHLHIHFKDHDNAALTMINHSVEAWEHLLFKEVIQKVNNMDIYYKSVQFYINEHPSQLNDLLSVLIQHIDHKQVVNIASAAGVLPLIKNYLLTAQRDDHKVVNHALNDLYIQEEDFAALRHSIDTYHNFDSVDLAKRLFEHDLLEFRRISAYLYKKNKHWDQSIALSKQDGLWKDAIDSAAESKNPALVEDLLRFFVKEGRKDCFASTTYICYDLIQPDVVLELAWSHGMTDFAMPFLIQTIKDTTTRIRDLEARLAPAAVDPNAAVSSQQQLPPGVVFLPPGYSAFPPPGL